MAIVLMVGALLAFKTTEKYFDIAKSLDIFATLFKEVNTTYVDDIDPEKLIRIGIDAMLESLDPYTDYIPEEELETFKITTTGQYGGVGALIGVINNKTVITHPYEGFPAFKGGLHVGDEIIAVDGKSVKGKSTDEISTLLKGQPKTKVEIRVNRYGVKEQIIFGLVREKITIKNLEYVGMVSSEIGYIKLSDFTPGAGHEVAEALKELKHAGARKIILDLRDNPGGLLVEAINVVNIFLPKGVEVVSTKGKIAEWNKTYSTLNTPVDSQIPCVILTNGGSASASEIVSGAMQDYDRAILVGQKTFGKGLVQTTRPLAYNAQLKVTTAKYYIPSGRCIQELDYTHRKKDGSVLKIPDSLRLSFKTKNGRITKDGGGLDPDIKIDDQYLGAVTVALLGENYFFEYATEYCNTHQTPVDFKSFSLSDVEYNHSISWLKERNFSYVTPLEKSMDELRTSAKKENSFSELQHSFEDLNRKIQTKKESDFARLKDVIKSTLEREIIFHYATHKGVYEYSLQHDQCVEAAKKILDDSIAFKKTLTQNSF